MSIMINVVVVHQKSPLLLVVYFYFVCNVFLSALTYILVLVLKISVVDSNILDNSWFFVLFLFWQETKKCA